MKPTWLGTCFFKLHFSKSFPFSLWTERKKMGKKDTKCINTKQMRTGKFCCAFNFGGFIVHWTYSSLISIHELQRQNYPLTMMSHFSIFDMAET